MNLTKAVFFLGGLDAEMNQIEKRLAEAGAIYLNKKLSWGAHASAYAQEIAQASAEGKKIILIELDNSSAPKTDWSPEKASVTLLHDAIEVDHHGERSAEPASILQVLNLLGVEPTREDYLIAANDCGNIPELVRIGASHEEIMWVRGLERAAQGITEEQEVDAELAIQNLTEICNGKVAVVRTQFSKTAPTCDRLYPKGYVVIIIAAADGETNICTTNQNNPLILGAVEKFGGYDYGEKSACAVFGDAKEIINYVSENFA